MWTVILQKEPYQRNETWQKATYPEALKVARSLSKQFYRNTERYEIDGFEQTVTVDARASYKPVEDRVRFVEDSRRLGGVLTSKPQVKRRETMSGSSGNHTQTGSKAPTKEKLITQLGQYWEGELSFAEYLNTITEVQMTREASQSGLGEGEDVAAGTRSGR